MTSIISAESKIQEAEAIYWRALEGKEKAWRPEQSDLLYRDQGKIQEVKAMYRRALEGREKAWGPEHTSTLDTVNSY